MNRNQIDKMFLEALMLIQTLFMNLSIPTFVRKPQEAVNSAPQNFEQGCIPSKKKLTESFKRIDQEMLEKVKNPKKTKFLCGNPKKTLT
jgi:hypothetical protein